jgi:SEC-C motif-containing protein
VQASRSPQSEVCPCGNQQRHIDCCKPFLEGQAAAPTAEALMRSRYTAYVLGNKPYLLATWHPSTRPAELSLDSEPPPQWLGLTVKHHALQDETHATVEFIARYKVNGRAHKLHETSRFVREDGRWFYVDGDIAR